jgi:hypothetical protein
MAKTSERHSIRVHLMMTPSELKSIDDWRRQQPDLPSRAAAIRSLIRRRLSARAEPAKSLSRPKSRS